MLIIYAHPNKEGHCGYILKRIEKSLKKISVEYEILDLYVEDYNPVMQPSEHYTSGHREISEETKRYQKLIKENDRFIIIYPTWWNATPAILKGFFDRTLTSHFSFRYEGIIPRGLLNGKVAVVTTTGGPIILEKLIFGNRSIKAVVNETLRFCGLKAKGYMIGSATKLTSGQKRKINKKINKILNFILD